MPTTYPAVSSNFDDPLLHLCPDPKDTPGNDAVQNGRNRLIYDCGFVNIMRN